MRRQRKREGEGEGEREAEIEGEIQEEIEGEIEGERGRGRERERRIHYQIEAILSGSDHFPGHCYFLHETLLVDRDHVIDSGT